ncbi:MAG: hypothetical protein QGD88_06810 [Anaerolineae bacterium]|nr:hypothetical protein [Anaerolineae bacterium]MDK1081174.1 hypothetical protein [Anaerolineae bacterium]
MNFDFGEVLTWAWQITRTLTYLRLTQVLEISETPIIANPDA